MEVKDGEVTGESGEEGEELEETHGVRRGEGETRLTGRGGRKHRTGRSLSWWKETEAPGALSGDPRARRSEEGARAQGVRSAFSEISDPGGLFLFRVK